MKPRQPISVPMLTWIMLLISACGALYKPNVVAQKSDSRLRLTKRLIEAKYCRRDSLELRLLFEFANVGKRDLILYRDSSIMGAYMISKDAESAKRKHYETQVSPMKTLSTSGLRLGIPDGSDFIVLKPNEVHHLQKTIYLPISEGRSHGTGLIEPGKHVLQLIVWTWYYSPAMAKEFRDRWRAKGVLWTESLTSVAMPFVVEANPTVVTCP